MDVRERGSRKMSDPAAGADAAAPSGWLDRVNAFGERVREMTGTASEVGDAHVGMRLDERHEVVERLRALVFEFLVLIG